MRVYAGEANASLHLVDVMQLLLEAELPVAEVGRHLGHHDGRAHAVLLGNPTAAQEPCVSAHARVSGIARRDGCNVAALANTDGFFEGKQDGLSLCCERLNSVADPLEAGKCFLLTRKC